MTLKGQWLMEKTTLEQPSKKQGAAKEKVPLHTNTKLLHYPLLPQKD